MHDENEHYALAKRHIAEGEERIARQREIVERRRSMGLGAAQSESLLEIMECSLGLMRDHLSLIEQELARIAEKSN